MKEIISGDERVYHLINSYLDENIDGEEIEYKISDCAIFEKTDDGILLFHPISWSLYLLTEDEYNNILTFNGNDLLKKWLIILPSYIDEMQLSKVIYRFRFTTDGGFFNPSYRQINNYIVFTTNLCNAKCEYCIEKNRLAPTTMSEDIAHKTSCFIDKNSSVKQPLYITWFGGEPLLNTKVIDTICDDLRAKKRNFYNHIITNGLLLTEENIIKMCDKWNIKSIQITLDGKGEVYNKIKNFNIANAFERVINNIKNILKLCTTPVYLSLRFNASYDNIDYLDELLKYVESEILPLQGIHKVRGRIVMRYETFVDNYNSNKKLREKIVELRTKYNNFIIHDKEWTLWYKKTSHCYADSCGGLAINPEGKIGVCEGWYEDGIMGDVENGITNIEPSRKYIMKFPDNIRFCLKNNCPLIASCTHYSPCPTSWSCTVPESIDLQIEFLKEKMVTTYNVWKHKKSLPIKKENGEE